MINGQLVGEDLDGVVGVPVGVLAPACGVVAGAVLMVGCEIVGVLIVVVIEGEDVGVVAEVAGAAVTVNDPVR